MALLKQPMGMPFQADTAPNLSTFTLNQSADAAEIVFRPGTTDPITHLGFSIGTKTGTATTWVAALQGVDGSTGFPDGTVKGGGTPASKTLTNAGLTASAFNWLALDNAYAPADANEALAAVFQYSSGTAPSAGVNDVQVITHNIGGQRSGNPYAIQNDNAVRSKQLNLPILGWKTATAVYGCPIQSAYATTFVSPNEVAMAFQLPSGAGSTYTVSQFRAVVTLPAAAANSFIASLYDGTTPIATAAAFDEEIVSGTSSRIIRGYFAPPYPALSFGNPYRLSFAQQTASALTVHGVVANSATDVAAFDGGQNFWLSTRSGGAWTDNLAARLLASIVVNDWTVAAGGSGGYSRSRVVNCA